MVQSENITEKVPDIPACSPGGFPWWVGMDDDSIDYLTSSLKSADRDGWIIRN